MTKLQRLQVKLSESRSAINDLAGKESRTEAEDSKLSELRTAHSALEAEYRTELEASPAPQVIDAESRALDRLVGRATVGAVLDAALEQRATSGAEAELQAHFGLKPHQIALEQLRPETRAVTPAPSDVGSEQRPIIAQIFPDSVVSFLGVDMPTVPVGESTYTVLTTGANVGTPAKNAAQGETTGAFTASVLSPKRAQASFFWSIEDEARLAGMEMSLRENLRMALSSKFDSILLTDSDEGLLGGGLTAPSNPGSVVNWTGYKKALTDQIDGRYASMTSEVRMLLGAATYSHSEAQYRTTASAGGPPESAYETLTRKAGGVRVSSHIPAPASNIQGAVAARTLAATHAAFPVWRGVTLIPDRITKAASGQIVLTAVALWGLKVLRADGFGRLKFKLA